VEGGGGGGRSSTWAATEGRSEEEVSLCFSFFSPFFSFLLLSSPFSFLSPLLSSLCPPLSYILSPPLLFSPPSYLPSSLTAPPLSPPLSSQLLYPRFFFSPHTLMYRQLVMCLFPKSDHFTFKHIQIDRLKERQVRHHPYFPLSLTLISSFSSLIC